MLTSFFESLGEDLSKKWLERLFGPAFLFWAGGLLLWLASQNLSARWDELTALPPVTQAALLIAALLLLAASDRLGEALSFSVLRFLEGYWGWPLRWLAAWRVHQRQKDEQRARQRQSSLLLKQDEGTLTAAERRELARLEARRRYTPRDLDNLAPTRLGDILRTAETRPRQRYGLDPLLLWPHLWLLLPESIRAELGSARARLDRLAQAWLWGLLFALWSFVWPWARVIALAWMGLAYALLLQAAAVFCDLVLAAFDTQRWRLYEALRWPLPAQSGEAEIASGQALTRFLQRGMTDHPIRFSSGKRIP
ncbi:MAG: hypothetical protein ACK4WK_08845 [Anaerolineae bacterium]